MAKPDSSERTEDRALSHLARAGIFFAFALVFSIFGSAALKSIFSAAITRSAESFAETVSSAFLWTGFIVWILTSLFRKPWRTTGKTCIAAVITYGCVLLFFIFMLSPGTPANSSALGTTPPAAKDNPSARAATPSDPRRPQAVASAPPETHPYHPYFVPNVKQEYEHALALEPSNLYYMLDVGGMLHKLGRHQEGDQMLERATRLAKNDDGDFFLALAQTREELGDLAGAVRYYQRACKLDVADACSDEVSAQFRLQRPDLQHPTKSAAKRPTVNPPPVKHPPQNCCDCAPQMTNMQCFQKCNAMIPRCGP